MEGFIALAVIVGLLAGFAMLAVRFGADSRSPRLNDWTRPVAG
jgi:hypothetical protein